MSIAMYGLQTSQPAYTFPSNLFNPDGGQGLVKQFFTYTLGDVVLRPFLSDSVYDQVLLPIELAEFTAGGKKYHFKFPLVLHPLWDETHEYLQVECDDYDLFLYAPNRKLLFKEIKDEFVMLWNVYVEGHEKLSPKAEKLKQTLMQNLIVAEVSRGA